MKHLGLFICTLGLACKSAPPAAEVVIPPPAPPPAAPVAEVIPEPHFAEGNGQVIALPVPGAVSVSFRVLFYSGSVDDPAGKEGLTLLTARLVAEGGTQKQTYAELLTTLYPMAANISAQVDKEQTVFSGQVHVDHLNRMVPLLAEVLATPRLGEADFARLKQDLLNDLEKRLRSTDDENLGKEILQQMIYPADHPYGHAVGGTVEGLRAITLADVRAHAAKIFGTQRLVIGLAGAVDSAVQKAFSDGLSKLPKGEPRLAIIPPAAQPEASEVVIAHKPNAQAIAISIGYPHYARRGHADWPALALIQSYFGEHRQFHGVLMSEIREKRGINYGDYAYVENFIQEGWSRNVQVNIARRRQHFEIWIRPVAPSDAVFSLRMALFLLDRLVKQGVSDADVQGAAQFLGGYTRLWEVTPSRRLGYALDDHFYGTQGYLDNLRASFPALNGAQVTASLRKHLVPGPVKIAIVAPDAEALKAALTSKAASPKSYSVEKPAEVIALDEQVKSFELGLDEANVRVVPVDTLFVR